METATPLKFCSNPQLVNRLLEEEERNNSGLYRGRLFRVRLSTLSIRQFFKLPNKTIKILFFLGFITLPGADNVRGNTASKKELPDSGAQVTFARVSRQGFIA